MLKRGIWLLWAVWLLTLAGGASARETRVLESLFVAQSCKPTDACAFTYTLASLTGVAIDEVEARIGPRDPGHLLLGVEFIDRDSAGIWFPGDKDHIVIQLTEAAMGDEQRALYQLGHEAFHAVAPTRGSVNVLEEGLATEFSLDFVRGRGYSITPSYVGAARYRQALAAVICLRGYVPALNQRITQLRSDGVRYGKATPQQLAVALPEAPRALVDAVALSFDQVAEIDATLTTYCGAANSTR
ncbi:MAG: hypothetical protein ACFCUG_04595 [Thiotrichales bacterium]